ncbi:TOG array regulator of axonemal microtubules protein 2 isoform X2 [Ranitomeya variabilis]|uniref:TOG array regulator of axonemal microtubules protein 2 isoform X2 n=1 Tax=Ranitomeya variabilis TaxID=490064 RepID=UPI004056E6D8
MTHNDFAAANFRASVAVYCGSVPKTKPGYMSLRNGSIDTNLQLCGNRWGPADTAALQSTIGLQVRRSYMWGADDLQPEILPSTLDNEWKNESFQIKMPNPTNPREEEVDSAALETSRLKDKLKRKMSEGSTARGAPSDLISLQYAPLKPAVPRSASQRLLNMTRPVPPIQRSPTPNNTEEECGTERNETERGNGKRGENTSCIESQQHMRSGEDKNRKPLSGVVIPPINKSSGVPAEPNGVSQTISNGQLRRSSPVPRAGAQPRSIVENDGTSTSSIDADHTDSCATNLMEDTLELIPSKTILPAAAKDTDDAPLPLIVKDEEGKENNARIIFTISKSAQDKMRQKQQEIENIRNEKRRSQQQLWDKVQGADSAELGNITSFSLSGVGAVPLSSEKRRAQNISLNKWVSRPSLPSIPTVKQDEANSDLRHSSAYSLPATFLDCFDWDSDSENGGLGMGPMSHPEQGLLEALKWLNNKDWEQKEKGLLSVRCLASWHPEVLFSRLHDVSIAVTREVNNLRSKVSRHAIRTLADLFKALRRNMDQEVEEISRVLLHKIGDSNDFIRDESEKSLGVMVEYVSPSKVLVALIAGGISHRNSSVRKCAAKYLLAVVEQLAVDRLLSGPRESTDTFLRTLLKLVQDGQQDTRFYGRRMFSLVMTHPKFQQQMERLIPSHDLRELIATVKQKEANDIVSDVPSAKSQRPVQKSSTVMSARPQDTPDADPSLNQPPVVDSEPQESPVPRRQLVRAAEVTEQLKELTKLLTAKEYQSKMDGVKLLTEHCRNNIKFVTSNITQIFDAFNPRMQDANKKVNQFALESAATMIPILKDSLHHVLVPMVTVITDNLNSKHAGIYTAAVRVLDTLISSIDNLWLLQPMAGRVRFLSGRAMNDVTDRLSGLVGAVYPRKPQAVERHILPVLWYFLSNITGNGVLPGRNGNFKDVVTRLTRSLSRVMGPSLEEYAGGQSQYAVKMLADILGTK